jgi:hypothetical protein
MNLFKEIFSGYAQRIRMENSFQMQKAAHVRPPQVKMEVATVLTDIKKQLASDPELKSTFDSINITVPGTTAQP